MEDKPRPLRLASCHLLDFGSLTSLHSQLGLHFTSCLGFQYLASQHQRKISFRLSVLSRILATDYLDFSGKPIITFTSTSRRKSSPEYFGIANSAENKLSPSALPLVAGHLLNILASLSPQNTLALSPVRLV